MRMLGKVLFIVGGALFAPAVVVMIVLAWVESVWFGAIITALAGWLLIGLAGVL